MQTSLPLKVMKLVICRNFILFAIKSWMHFTVKAVLQIPVKHTVFPMNKFSSVHQDFVFHLDFSSTHVKFYSFIKRIFHQIKVALRAFLLVVFWYIACCWGYMPLFAIIALSRLLLNYIQFGSSECSVAITVMHGDHTGLLYHKSNR